MRLAFLVLLILASTSCISPPEVDRIARVSPHDKFKYEIEIHARVNSFGSPCHISCSPTRVDERHWFYVDRLEGRIEAKDIVLTYERNKFTFAQSALQGSITISNDILTVDLKIPYYEKANTVDHYTPYRYNGRYDLRERDGD